MAADLGIMAEAIRQAPNSFADVWAVVSEHAAGMVEIRHVPPIHELDGFRSRDDFIRYVAEEATVFPRSFAECTVAVNVQVERDRLCWDPLSLSGRLKGSGHHVDIQFRVELHFENGLLVKVVGQQTGATPKTDIIEWLKAIESVGGFNPPRALPAAPTTDE